MLIFSKMLREKSTEQNILTSTNTNHMYIFDEGENECNGYLEIAANGHIININKNTFVVGRSAEHCDYSFSNNRISKIHATFIFKNGTAYIVEHNSTNGTYINGSTKRIGNNTEYCIIDGDVITIGNENVTFRISKKQNKTR